MAISSSLNAPSNVWVAFLFINGGLIFDNVTDVGPWYSLNGQKLFENKASMMTGPLSSGLVDIYKDAPASKQYWTGAKQDGTFDTNCSGWNSASSNTFGAYGDFANASTWIRTATKSCDMRLPLLCIEQ